MVRIGREHPFSLWIKGKPLSARKSRKSLSPYITNIRKVAAKVIPNPIKTSRIEIEILFFSKKSIRADIDNVIKPILDALKGIVYKYDSQVSTIKVTAIPEDEPIGFEGVDLEVCRRLSKNNPKEFLINIHKKELFYIKMP